MSRKKSRIVGFLMIVASIIISLTMVDIHDSNSTDVMLSMMMLVTTYLGITLYIINMEEDGIHKAMYDIAEYVTRFI